MAKQPLKKETVKKEPIVIIGYFWTDEGEKFARYSDGTVKKVK